MKSSPSTRTLRRGLVAGAFVAVTFCFVTWAALESAEVVVLRTFDADGTVHESRVWIAEDEHGTPWIEAAEATKAFYLRLLAQPEIELVRGGKVLAVRAVPRPGDEGHQRIREMLAAKYRWRDAWIGLLVDTSGSVAVRLEPLPATRDSLSPASAEVR